MKLKAITKNVLLVSSMLLLPSVVLADSVKTNLHDYMEAYAKPLDKLAKRSNAEPLVRFLQQVPAFAQEADQAKWKEIVEKAIAEGNPSSSCRACHSEYKRGYAKAHRDHHVEVPAELVAMLEESFK